MNEVASLTTGLEFSLSVVVLILLWVAYQQSLGIKDRPDLQSINPLLGRRPTDGHVVLYFIALAGLFACVAMLASLCVWPLWLRFGWIGMWFAVSAVTLWNNQRLGL